MLLDRRVFVFQELQLVLAECVEYVAPWSAGLDHAASQLLRALDPVHGGFGRAPKFPPSMTLSSLLRQHHRTGDVAVLKAVELTLDKMARGGMYDQLGGGFHRYSVDEKWLAPHFEKMLYDNALLSRIYLDAFLVTGNEFYKQIAVETLDYVRREMTDPTKVGERTVLEHEGLKVHLIWV